MASTKDLKQKVQDILDKQSALQDAVITLSEEVEDLNKENELLQQENMELRKQIQHSQPQSITEVVSTIMDETVIEEPVMMEEQIMIEEPETQQEPVHENLVVDPVKPEKRFNLRDTAIAEFFLGKNVIAKIASILIFLGIVSFGQLAYVEWLDSLGRVLLIVFAATVFGVIAYLAEKREYITFSNVFYGIAATILMYSNVLASATFNLYSETWYSYLNIVLMAGLFVYFYQRRYEFLDAVLFILYLLIWTFSISLHADGGSISSYIEQILLYGVFGGITYFYYFKYYHSNLKMKNIFTIFFGLFALFGYLWILLDYSTSSNSSSYYFTLFMTSTMVLFVSGFVYFTNLIQPQQELFKRHYILPVTTIILLLVSAGVFSSGLEYYVRFNTGMMGWLFFGVLVVPLYGLLYKRDGELFHRYRLLYFYSAGIALGIYALTAQSLQKYEIAEPSWRILINAILLVSMYIVYRFLKTNEHRNVAIGFTVIILIQLLQFHVMENSYLFKDIMVGIVGVSMVVSLFVTYHIFKRIKQEEEQMDNALIHGLFVVVFLPLVVTLTNELLSSDAAYIFGVLMLIVIGYRWLLELRFFNIEYKKQLVLGMNVLLLIFVLFLNAQYFNHDYSTFDHILKFLILLGYNAYIVYSLREIFRDYAPLDQQENYFIGFYVAGVILHSLFLHNYINVSYDRIILSSYFLISSAIVVLAGFRYQWSLTRKIGLGAIYFSLGKIFVYDLMGTDMRTFVRMITFFILGFILLAISILYAYLERTYGNTEAPPQEKVVKPQKTYKTKL